MSWKWLQILALLLTLLPSNTRATDAAACSSSCGSVVIRHPFRLSGDPGSCGSPFPELSCRNNRTSLNINSKELGVEFISYDNQTIRVIDPGLRSNNCSALPKYSWSTDDMTVNHKNLFRFPEYSFATYVSCNQSMYSPLYMSTSPCINSSSSTYFYLMLPPELSNLGVPCTTIATVPIKYPTIATAYLEVWSDLVMGYELSWWPALCWDCEAAGGTCINTDNYSEIRWWSYETGCTKPCRRAFQSIKCFFQLAMLYLRDNGRLIITITGYVLAGRTAIGMMCLFSFLIYQARKRHQSKNSPIEQFLDKYRNLTPERYSYGEIKRMTRGFKEKLGQGGCGTVFKGTLASGRPVAVKILGKVRGNGEEFINEVATIGRIHHVNVVRLIGFGFEGSKRALIYDYMPNGSLDKYIYLKEGQSSTLSLEKMYEITIAIARGIEYLHRGCNMQILHFDIKPHNILLDANFTPKVSDFGLAKLYPTNRSIVSVSAAKGTIGYIAPELIYRSFGRISYKSDVYSFGRMLLEMIGRRSNMEGIESDSSQAYFPVWAYDKLMEGGDVEINVVTESESVFVKKLLIVGLWCIQMTPEDRPSMHKVVEMLQGSVEELSMPSRPSLLYPSLAAMENSQTTDSSEDLSLPNTNTLNDISIMY